MEMFFNCMGFTASAHVDLVGRSGSIWMLWNPILVNVRVVEGSSQQITTTISRQDYQDWLLSAVYASPNARKRDELWDHLEAIAQSMKEPWLVASDFNDFTSASEKRGLYQSNSQSISQDQRRSRKFNERLNNCNLMDLECIGPRLTWSNNRKGWANTMVRLDRAMCNTEWRTTFPDGSVWNLPRTYSDHSPMMVFTQAPSLSKKLETLAHDATIWNKKVFGNIFRRKRWLLGRIEGIQQSQAHNYSYNLHNLEIDLVDQYNKILYPEELLWFQKSRAKWITQGERNTRFFPLTTLAKRKRRKIDMLKNDNRDWVDQPDQLKDLILNYFTNLFNQTPNCSLEHWNNLVACKLTLEDNTKRTKAITDDEV
ncbi:uncharacterized protein LOC114304080 [Camellia sinensis]|uniref:uncharacterized protein LOC114304080 n=1 Tax=Camellia sinensis TaxID=4442 RepID=UPI0010357D12|nr:uncharacterized protein LOC114304080 [Camellia sinensis]